MLNKYTVADKEVDNKLNAAFAKAVCSSRVDIVIIHEVFGYEAVTDCAGSTLAN